MALPSGLPQISDLGSLLSSYNGDYVDIPTIAAPFTTVVGRAPMLDLSKDINARMGIDRLVIQGISQVFNEVGANQSQVHRAVNDPYDQIRFCGSWDWYANGNGVGVTTSIVNDYVEFSFYGTGCNMFGLMYSDAKDWRVSIDGGAESSNIHVQVNQVQSARNISPNNVINLARGLALGFHTVRVRCAAINMNVSGFETIRETANLTINPGTMWKAGKKYYLPSQVTTSYNTDFESGTLGGRGGRVSVYLKQNGTIGKAVTPTNSTSAFMGAADHTNEEVARTYHFREFGANQGLDFSNMVNNVNTSARFTLDDNVTTAYGNNVASFFDGGNDGIFQSSSAGFICLSFIGTGLDVTWFRSVTLGTDTYQIYVDNVDVTGAVAASTLFGASGNRRLKIASGLPYGQHVVRITRNAIAGFGPTFKDFIVYQPKTPTIPTDAVEISTYNIMANYVFNSGTTYEHMSTGIAVRQSARDTYLAGGGWSVTNDISGYGGQRFITPTNGATAVSTFTGVGFEFIHFATLNAGVKSISINGQLLTAANFPGVTVQTNAGLTYNNANGQISGTPNTNGAKVSVNGLAYGTYTVTITKVSGTELEIEAFAPIQLIHSHKMNGPVVSNGQINCGNQGLNSTRKFIPGKTIGAASKNISRAMGLTLAPTISGTTSLVPFTDVGTPINVTTGTAIKVNYSALTQQQSGSASTLTLYVYVNGWLIQSSGRGHSFSVNGHYATQADTLTIPVSPGVYFVQVYWATNNAAAPMQSLNNHRAITVEEI